VAHGRIAKVERKDGTALSVLANLRQSRRSLLRRVSGRSSLSPKTVSFSGRRDRGRARFPSIRPFRPRAEGDWDYLVGSASVKLMKLSMCRANGCGSCALLLHE